MGERVRSPFWWVCVIAGAALVLGTIGPWVRVLFVDVSGMEVDGGFVVLLCGLVVAAMPFIQERERAGWPCGIAIGGAAVALLFLLAFTVGVWGDDSAEDEVFGIQASEFVDPGWGLWIAWLGGLTGLASSIALLVQRRRQRAALPAAAAPAMPMAIPQQPTAAPGWYPHPAGGWGWWDGYRWTEHRP